MTIDEFVKRLTAEEDVRVRQDMIVYGTRVIANHYDVYRLLSKNRGSGPLPTRQEVDGALRQYILSGKAPDTPLGKRIDTL